MGSTLSSLGYSIIKKGSNVLQVVCKGGTCSGSCLQASRSWQAGGSSKAGSFAEGSHRHSNSTAGGHTFQIIA